MTIARGLRASKRLLTDVGHDWYEDLYVVEVDTYYGSWLTTMFKYFRDSPASGTVMYGLLPSEVRKYEGIRYHARWQHTSRLHINNWPLACAFPVTNQTSVIAIRYADYERGEK